MKLLLVCEYWYGTGGWSYRKHLERLGCEVEIFDYRRSFFSTGASLPLVSAATRRVNARMMNRAFIEAAKRFRPDLVLFLKGETITASAIREVKAACNPVLAQWYPDGPFNVEVKNATRESIASIPLFDLYYIYARSLMQPLRDAGARRVEYLPFCYDPDMLRPPEHVSDDDIRKYATDVVFAGTWEPMRQWWLEEIPGFNLSIWGNMWDRVPPGAPIRAKWKGSAVYGEEISKLFAVSKIHLNFLRAQNSDSNNVRSFEIPGFGGFLLTQRSREQAEELFVEGAEIACFSTGEELREKIRWYLDHDDERLAIAQRGHERAVREHQAIHRLERIVRDAKQLLGA
ncbi:MAG: glycosyltransferase [Ignavibacteria bacterium]|nr:glycosyltransferase [Ignavibacteria bacterium]